MPCRATPTLDLPGPESQDGEGLAQVTSWCVCGGVIAGPETRFAGPSQPVPHHTHVSQGLCAHDDLFSETRSMSFQRHPYLSTPRPPG